MESSLGDIFDPRLVKINLDGNTKEKVLAELIDEIAALHPECNADNLLNALMKREGQLTSGIGAGVAIPHAFSRELKSITGAIGISLKGIDYNALDNKPVHVIFFLAMTERKEENHLLVLNRILQLVQSEAMLQIKNAKNAKEIHTILSKVHLG